MKANIIDLFTIFQMYCMIERTSSSNFFDIGDKPRLAQYKRLRDESVYRGVLLSRSPEQKNEMCEDFYSAQLYVNSYTEEEIADRSKTILLISDSFSKKTLDEELTYDLYVRDMVDDRLRGSEKRKDLVMRCFGRRFSKRTPTLYTWYHVTYAFQPKWLFYGLRKNSYDKSFEFMGFVTLSPDLVSLEQAQLETHYVNMERTIKALSEESRKYVDQIKNREVLSTLSLKHKYILCASILSSPVYRDERLEFSFTWMYENTDTLQSISKDVSVKNPIHADERLKADCILCKAFKYGGRRNSEPQNLYLTSSYDNQHSLIVLKEEGDRVYVDKHFKNLPILINLRKEMEYDQLILHYSQDQEV